jgi:hypothetical protein
MAESINYGASWTQICNRALGRLGTASIDTLDEGTRNAEYCQRFLPQAVEDVLGRYGFRFSRRRARLAPDAERPEFGWRRQFNLPVDCIRLIAVYGGSGSVADETERVPYGVENGKILADAEELRIVYNFRPDDPDLMPSAVRNAVSVRLAGLLSTALTSNEQLIALLASEYPQALAIAESEDAAMNFVPPDETFFTERRGG